MVSGRWKRLLAKVSAELLMLVSNLVDRSSKYDDSFCASRDCSVIFM